MTTPTSNLRGSATHTDPATANTARIVAEGRHQQPHFAHGDTSASPAMSSSTTVVSGGKRIEAPTEPLCRCCGQPLHTYTQPALVAWRADRTMVECGNRVCALFMQTFCAEDYADVDLSAYGVKKGV